MSLHIKNIFWEQELDKTATVKKSLTVQKENKTISSESLYSFTEMKICKSLVELVQKLHKFNFRGNYRGNLGSSADDVALLVVYVAKPRLTIFSKPNHYSPKS